VCVNSAQYRTKGNTVCIQVTPSYCATLEYHPKYIFKKSVTTIKSTTTIVVRQSKTKQRTQNQILEEMSLDTKNTT